MRPLMRLLPTLAAAVLLASCGPQPPEPLPFEPAGPSAAPDASTFGPFPVGVRTVVVEDPDRPKPDGTPRRLVTEVWYPAVEAARGAAGLAYDLRSMLTEEQLRSVEGMALPLLQTSAVPDAAPRRDRGPYPLVVFSHGQGSMRWQSTYYTVVLASHGYVVVSPDHEGGTLSDLLRTRDLNPGAGAEDRPKDVSLLIDWATAPPEGHFLTGLVDGERIGVTGHSFGGFTSLNSAGRDKRIRAIVPQAPPQAALSFIGLARPVRLGIPVMLQAAHKDRTLTWDENIPGLWDMLERPRWLLDLVNGGHFTFSDLCRFDLADLARRAGIDGVESALRDGCDAEAPSPELAGRLINHFAVGFFNAVLRGSGGSAAKLTQAEADRIGTGTAALTADP